MIEWCLIVREKYLNLILNRSKVWEIRTQPLFDTGERIALGYAGHIGGYATVSEVKRLTVREMKKHNRLHLANDVIEKRWSKRPFLYALVLSEVTRNFRNSTYPRSYGSAKVRLTGS